MIKHLRNLIWQKFIIGIICIIVSLPVQSQSSVVQGTVLDQVGEPLVGVSVQIKGTDTRTITDTDGHFSIQCPSNSVLVCTYIGFVPYETKATTKPMVIKLTEESQDLKELVVIGYGTQKKVNLTGAVSAVTGEELVKRPVANTTTMLQGQMPGLRITSDRGMPGSENVQIRVRGQGTYSSTGSNPLVLINGVEGNLSTLDPNMIESVSVLKDAASAAIYGSRAANGVILITTKNGSTNNEKFTITYNGNFAVHTPTTMLDLVWDSPTYMKYFNIAEQNSGNTANKYTDDQIAAYTNPENRDEYPSFDWLDWYINPAFVQNHNMSVSGSIDKTSYNVSLSALDQPGTERAQKYKRFNVAADLTSQINRFTKFGIYFSGSRSYRQQTRQGDTDALLSTISQAPTYKPYFYVDGIKYYTNRAYPSEGNNKNMYAIIDNEYFIKHVDTDVNVQAWVQFDILKNLSWYNKGAVRYNQNQHKDWRTDDVKTYYYHSHEFAGMLNSGGSGLTDTMYHSTYLNFYSYLKYNWESKNKAHNLSTMLGYNVESYRYDSLSGYRQVFDFPLHELDAGTTSTVTNSGNAHEWGLQSIFFRADYNYKQRYLLEINARYDGSSRISKSNRWGWFPSASAAWRITEEDFAKNVNWLDNLKIRASYGKLGNQAIDLYSYYSTVKTGEDYSFDNNTLSSGVAQRNISNPNLKWESTTIFDIGFDATILKNLSMTFDWYNKKTTDILRSAQGNAILALTAPYINGGEMVNKGVEFSVNYTNTIKKGGLRGLEYNAVFFVEHTKNTLEKYGSDVISKGQIFREGEPYGSFYMLEACGIFVDEADVANSPKQYSDNTKPGDIKYLDWNRDGVVNDNDRHIVGKRFPDLEYSISLGMTWKGIDFSFLGQGVQGVNHYADGWGIRPFRQGSPISHDYIKHMWTEENPNHAKYPKLYYDNMGGTKNTRPSTFYLFNGSYFRVKNITLGYTFPQKLTKKLSINKLRLYFSGDNLFTITKFPQGGDPERNYTSNTGTRLVYYPQNKIYSFGINVTL